MGAAITHGGLARSGSLCKCNVCGCVEVYRPGFDFFTRVPGGTGPLICERCIAGPRLKLTGKEQVTVKELDALLAIVGQEMLDAQLEEVELGRIMVTALRALHDVDDLQKTLTLALAGFDMKCPGCGLTHRVNLTGSERRADA